VRMWILQGAIAV